MDATPEIILATRVRDQLKADKQAVFADFNAHGHVGHLLTRLRRAVDAALVEAWRGLGLPDDSALVAVGGYGRGELFPFSDVDVLLLLPSEPDEDTTSRLEKFIGLCWDLGLEIGSSVRTVDDCIRESRQDVTIQTSLLEARLLTGNRKLFAELQTRYQADLTRAPSSRPSCWKCASATPSTRTRPTRSSPTARKAPAACVTCR